MNAKILLDAFNRLGDEPGSIQQLRKLIVALAISGRFDTLGRITLRPSDMLRQIEARIANLSRHGVARKEQRFKSVTINDLPECFCEPSKFIRLGQIAKIEKGLTGISKANPGKYPLVVTAEDRGSCDHYDFDGAAAIVPLVSSTGHGKASLQRLHYQEGRFALGSILAAIFPYAPELVSARFLFEYLSAFKNELLVTRMIGTANVSLSIGKMADVPVPLISPSIQRKVDELMGLCDGLAAARTDREAARDQLTVASLARLDASDSETFQADTRFALNALPSLTARPDQVKDLRQTILNLAVRGKLVPQDANDESALELINRISALPWIKKRKSSDLAPDDDALIGAFPLPGGWSWTSVEMLVRPNEIVTYGILKPEWAADGVPTVRVTEMKTGTIDVASLPKCKTLRAAKFQKTTLVPGDLLISKDGTIGKTAFVPPELAGGNITQHVIRFPICNMVNPQYIRLTIDAPFCQAWMAGETKGIALQGVNVGDFRRMPIPLPPLAEQQRIVAKVDTLMSLCDRLEVSLGVAVQSRRRLLDALISEALMPNDATGIVAAAE